MGNELAVLQRLQDLARQAKQAVKSKEQVATVKSLMQQIGQIARSHSKVQEDINPTPGFHPLLGTFRAIWADCVDGEETIPDDQMELEFRLTRVEEVIQDYLSTHGS